MKILNYFFENKKCWYSFVIKCEKGMKFMKRKWGIEEMTEEKEKKKKKETSEKTRIWRVGHQVPEIYNG